MKQITSGLMGKSVLTFLMIAFVQTIALAQDASGSSADSKSVSVTTETSNWYAAPWVWVVGGILLILLLVALLRGRSSDGSATTRTNRVTVTKTTTSDDIV